MEKIKVTVGWAGNNYSACTENFENLNGVILVTGKTFTQLKTELVSAMAFHIEGCKEDGDVLPEWLLKGDYEYEYDFQMSAILHNLDGILTRSAISRATGINQKQIGHYASGLKMPRPQQRKKIVEGIRAIGRELTSVV